MYFIERGPSKSRMRTAFYSYEEAEKYFVKEFVEAQRDLWDVHSARYNPVPNLRKNFSEVRSEDDYIIVEG